MQFCFNQHRSPTRLPAHDHPCPYSPNEFHHLKVISDPCQPVMLHQVRPAREITMIIRARILLHAPFALRFCHTERTRKSIAIHCTWHTFQRLTLRKQVRFQHQRPRPQETLSNDKSSEPWAIRSSSCCGSNRAKFLLQTLTTSIGLGSVLKTHENP